MPEIADRYSSIADDFTARVGNIQADAWLAKSPCTEWTARDVVVHVIDTHHRVLSALDGSESAVVTPDDDLPARWSAATGTLLHALTDEERASRIVGGVFGEQRFDSLVSRLLCADTLIHTWDLARATGQQELLDPVAVGKAMEFLTPLTKPSAGRADSRPRSGHRRTPTSRLGC